MVTFDVSLDYLVYDNPEPINYTSVRNTGPMTDTIQAAFRRMLTSREMAASGGAYQAGDLAWIVPQALVEGSIGTPKPGDFLIDALTQSRYTVLSADFLAQRSDWKLVTRNLAIAYDLQDTILIQRAGISYDAAGAVLKTWPEQGGGSILYSQVMARVQPITAETVSERGIVGLKVSHQVFVSIQVPNVTNEDRIKVIAQDGKILPAPLYLEILGYKNPDRIDELPLLDAALVP